MKKFILSTFVVAVLGLAACGATSNDDRGRGMLSTPSASPSSSAVPSVFPTPSEMTATLPGGLVPTPTTYKPVPKPTTAKPTTKSVPKPTTKKPAPTGNVHPGAFCANAGAIGTYNGKVYTCKKSATDQRLRWRQ